MAEELTDLHELQLQSFLRFSNLKRQQHIREILQCIDECKESHIRAGEMYSFLEVSDILDGLRHEMRRYITKEVENAYHSSALLIQMQLIQAQTAGTSISVDTTQLENEAHLQRIKACEQAAMTRPAADFAMKRAGAVGALGGAGVRTVADSAVVAQRDQLRSEVDALRSRLESLQTATDAALSSKTVIAQQLSQAQATIVSREAELTRLQDQLLSKAESEAAAGVAKQADQAAAAHRVLEAAESTKVQMTELQQQVKARDAQVKAAEQALAGKVQDSKQWQQMKQMMQQKSREVVELRRRLTKYEPEEISSADAGASAGRGK